MQESASLFESKTDLEKYTKDFNYLKKCCKEALLVAENSDSLSKTMVEFIHKFEPIYIQR